MPGNLVICGNCVTLLTTRTLLLAHLGLAAQTVLGVANLRTQNAEALILCHTLNEAEQDEAVSIVRGTRPDTPVLVVSDDDLGPEHASLSRVSSFAGTESFLAAVRKLVLSGETVSAV